jgi:hypothetical protein
MKCIRALRKNGIIYTQHRYKTVGKDKRRTSSRTVLIHYIKFREWLRKCTIAAGNFKNLVNCKINKITGEITSTIDKLFLGGAKGIDCRAVDITDIQPISTPCF